METDYSIARILKQRRRWFFAVVGIAYAIIISGYLGYTVQRKVAEMEQRKLETRMLLLASEIGEERDLVRELMLAKRAVRTFPEILFEENWPDEAKKTEVSRIFEYAKFAMGKKDYGRAAALYEEAQGIYRTLEAQYQLGLLKYLEGDPGACVQYWRAVSESDGGKYAELRFHMAIVLYETGQTGQSMRYIKEFLALKKSTGKVMQRS